MDNFTNEFTILIVDDISTNVLLVETILKKEGYTLLTTDNGRDALQIVKEKHPNLILLDIMMPEMDGYEVLTQLKSNPETNNIPVIIMSALNDMESIVKGYQLGAIEYVTKPFQREELVKRVAHRYELYSIERYKKALESTIESRDMLYSVISHELRTPLNSLKVLNTSVLNQVNKEIIGENIHQLLLTINKTSEETSLLLDNLLNWSKLSQNKLSLHKQTTDINAVVDSVTDTYVPLADLKNITIIRKGLDNMLHGEADVEMLKLIVRNLLSNAIKFSKENSRIEISTKHAEKGEISCCVKDKGIGIKEEIQQNLLNKEKRVSTPGTDNEQGAGLGLNVSQAIIALHRGKISYKSTVGEGTEFHFSINS